MKNIDKIEEIDKILNENMITLGYFTSSDCNMCKDLFPKVKNMISKYPKVSFFRAETDKLLSLVSKFNFYVVPTIILFVDSKETIKQSRAINLKEIEENINRYCELIYGDEI